MIGFFPAMTEQEVNKQAMLSLAHVGDAVYELLVRSMLCARGPVQVNSEHRRTVTYVNAGAQAKAAGIILPMLSEKELSVYKRGRNTRVKSVPHNADIGDYHAATGFEALLGYLYLAGKDARARELFAEAYAGVAEHVIEKIK